MSTDSGMAIGIGVAMLAAALIPLLALFFVVRAFTKRGRLPKWAPYAAVPLGLVLGVFVTFFVVFDDLGKAAIDSRSAPTIDVIVPRAFRGPLYVFFDSAAGPLRQTAPNRYRVELDMSGTVLAGWYPRARDLFAYATYLVRYPDGTTPPLVQPGMSGGGYNSVVFTKLFVGTQSEYDADYTRREKDGRLELLFTAGKLVGHKTNTGINFVIL